LQLTGITELHHAIPKSKIMKNVKRILAIVATLVFLMTVAPPTTKASPPVSVSFQFFYDNLSPYGAWVSYSNYGYAWVPRVSGFRPYVSGGHWVYTDAGWMWASSYDWGWAPFHYGSWAYDPYYGWLWVPGYDWAPAWVTWGYYDGYYGWAPLAPGISFSVGYYPPINYWVFASPRYMTVNNFNNNYYVYSGNRIPLGNNTSITNVKSINVVDNTASYSGKAYNAGPRKAEFQKAGGTDLKAVSIRENGRPGKSSISGEAVSVYRPKVSGDKSAKPSKVTPLENIKRSGAEKAKEPGKTIESEKRVAPERKSDVKDRQPKQEERKPEMKEQPRQERQKPEIKEEPKERRQEREQAKPRESKPDINREQPKERQPEMREPKQDNPKREVQPNDKIKREPEPREKPRQEIDRERNPERDGELRQQRERIPREQNRIERNNRPGKPQQTSPPQQQRQPQQRERGEKKNPK
jgi:hypothetical protein